MASSHLTSETDLLDDPATLRNIPFFSSLTNMEIEAVRGKMRVRHHVKRDVVIQKNRNADSLLFLLNGQLQVVDITDEGRIICLRILSSGEFFGEIALITQQQHAASVVAVGPATIALLPRAAALHLFSHSPSITQLMLQHLANKIQQESNLRVLLSTHDKFRRVYTLLLMLKKTKPGGLEVIENVPTHQDIANMVNTSRETVTRALSLLFKQGIVKKDLRRIIIYKPTQLQQLSRDNPARDQQ